MGFRVGLQYMRRSSLKWHRRFPLLGERVRVRGKALKPFFMRPKTYRSGSGFFGLIVLPKSLQLAVCLLREKCGGLGPPA